MAERLACDLAAQGLVIISGMARGVDTASHRGAISAKGKTIAVFGTGVDVIYPKENSRLTDQILALGGGVPIQIGDEVIGGVGSSGSSQEQDDACAKAGVAKIAGLLK